MDLVALRMKDKSTHLPLSFLSRRLRCYEMEGEWLFWRASVNAAEARKAEVASVEAVLKPIPPFITGSVPVALGVIKSTFKINESPSLRIVSNRVRSGCSSQSEVLNVYSRRGILLEKYQSVVCL